MKLIPGLIATLTGVLNFKRLLIIQLNIHFNMNTFHTFCIFTRISAFSLYFSIWQCNIALVYLQSSNMDMFPVILALSVICVAYGVDWTCPNKAPSNEVNGCSVPFKLPAPFKKAFTPACNIHDVCYGCVSTITVQVLVWVGRMLQRLARLLRKRKVPGSNPTVEKNFPFCKSCLLLVPHSSTLPVQIKSTMTFTLLLPCFR